MASFYGTLTLESDPSAAVRALVEVGGGAVTMLAGDTEIGSWQRTEITVYEEGTSFVVTADGEHLILDLDEGAAFGAAVGLDPAPARKTAPRGRGTRSEDTAAVAPKRKRLFGRRRERSDEQPADSLAPEVLTPEPADSRSEPAPEPAAEQPADSHAPEVLTPEPADSRSEPAPDDPRPAPTPFLEPQPAPTAQLPDVTEPPGNVLGAQNDPTLSFVEPAAAQRTNTAEPVADDGPIIEPVIAIEPIATNLPADVTNTTPFGVGGGEPAAESANGTADAASQPAAAPPVGTDPSTTLEATPPPPPEPAPPVVRSDPEPPRPQPQVSQPAPNPAVPKGNVRDGMSAELRDLRSRSAASYSEDETLKRPIGYALAGAGLLLVVGSITTWGAARLGATDIAFGRVLAGLAGLFAIASAYTAVFNEQRRVGGWTATGGGAIALLIIVLAARQARVGWGFILAFLAASAVITLGVVTLGNAAAAPSLRRPDDE